MLIGKVLFTQAQLNLDEVQPLTSESYTFTGFPGHGNLGLWPVVVSLKYSTEA